MNTKKILLVDDDSDDQVFFMEALAEVDDSVECLIANNGKEALDLLGELESPDLVLLDLNMPVMNGIDCLVEMRKDENLKSIPVVIFTTASDPETIRRTYDLGANAFFKKPNDFQTMRNKLETLLKDKDLKTILHGGPAFSFADFFL